jgi:FkbM family methyltransferase
VEAWYRLRGYVPATLNGQRFKCDPAHADYWGRVSRGEWEPQTFRLLSDCLGPESVCCDIGAWIGPTVLYSAKRCRQVYCFEPDIFAYEPLLTNIRLNQLRNVLPFNLALTGRDGMCKMGSAWKKLGNSTTSILHTKTSALLDVQTMSWETWLRIANPGRVNFIKMDIEGGEFELIPSMGSYLAANKPAVFLSLHTPFLPEPDRPAALEKIRQAMSVYGTCRNEKMERVGLDELTGPATLTRNRSFLFTD